MKQIIPIFLIIVIISCIVLPFAVSASSTFVLEVHKVYSSTISFYYAKSNSGQVYHIDFGNDSVIYVTLDKNTTYYIYYKNNSSSNQYYTPCFYPGYNQLSRNSNSPTDIHNLLNIYGTGYIREYTSTGQTLSGARSYITYNQTNVTVTFNSNGGSTIEPITDIEPGSTVNLDVTVGGITTYNPAFIPERDGYLFDYWYQIDYPLTPVHSITVNDDITLIAKWSNDPALAHITFGDGFYSDVNHTNTLTGGYYEIGSYIDFYTYYSGSQIYRGKVAFTDLNDDVTYYQGPSGSYRYHVQVTESGSFSLVLLDYCTTYVSLYPDVEGTYVSHIQYAIQDGEWHNYTFDDLLTIQPGYQLHFRFYLTAPYVITEGVYYYSLTDYENVFIRSDVKTNNDWQTFWTEVYLDFTVNHSGTLYLYVKSISDFDITSRDIVGIYDESTGEFSWAISEVSLLDTNWEDVASNVPQNLAYMFDGIYSLSGLAIIVPLCMMVAFGLWFIRRS